jgi:hypothetical protein
MKRIIHKRPIPVDHWGQQDLLFPEGAVFLHVGYTVGPGLTIWYLVEEGNVTKPHVKRKIMVLPTGDPADIPSSFWHIGTVVHGLVFHVFGA